MTTPAVADLVAAIDKIKSLTPEDAPWTYEEMYIDRGSIDDTEAVAIILNAVVSGALSPAATEPVAWRARHSEAEEWQYFTSRPSWWEVQPLYAAPPPPPVTVEAAALEHLQNVMGHIDTPIARRRLNINDTQPEWLVEARKYLAAKGEA